MPPPEPRRRPRPREHAQPVLDDAHGELPVLPMSEVVTSYYLGVFMTMPYKLENYRFLLFLLSSTYARPSFPACAASSMMRSTYSST